MPKKFLQEAFGPVAATSAFLIGSLLLNYYAFGDEQKKIVHDQKERQASAGRLEQRYNHSPRLRAVVVELNKNFGYDGNGDRVDWLLRTGVSLELSAENMPQDAMIQVFKDRLRINPFLRVQDQALAVSLVILYIKGQISDGVPYGSGESFTVATRMLVPTGHPPSKASPHAVVSP